MPNWVWVDVETDGLDVNRHHLLEIAVIITDEELNELGSTHAVVKYDHRVAGRMRAAAAPVVREMHDKTGLWEKLRTGEPLGVIDKAFTEYLQLFGEPRTMPVAGNSVRLDMNFMDKYLPNMSAYLDYHMRDVSTIVGIGTDWYREEFEKHSDHTAMTDIRESIRELKHYRERIFQNVEAAKKLLIREGYTVLYPSISEAETHAQLLEARAEMEAPNAAEALRFMARVIREGRELPEHMKGTPS